MPQKCLVLAFWQYLNCRIYKDDLTIQYFLTWGKTALGSLFSNSLFVHLWTKYTNQANIYLFKVNNRNTRKKCEICSKLIIKIGKFDLASALQIYWKIRLAQAFSVNFAKFFKNIFFIEQLRTTASDIRSEIWQKSLKTHANVKKCWATPSKLLLIIFLYVSN